LAKGGFWLSLSQLAIASAGIFLAAILANFLSPEIYGTYKYVLSIIGILMITSLSGMNQAIIQSVAKGYEGSVMAGLKLRIKWGLLGGILCIAFAGYYWFNDNIILASSFFFVSFFVPFFDSFNMYNAFLNGRKDFKSIGKYNLFFFSGLVISMAITVYLTKNVVIILLVYYTYHTIVRGLLALYIFKKSQLNQEKRRGTLNFGKHLSLMDVIGNIANHLDKIFVFHFLGPIQVAIYSIAILPIQQIRGPQLRNLGRLTLPKVSNRSLSELRKSLPGKIFRLYIFIIPIVLIYIFAAPYLYQLLFPQYLESIQYSQIFVLSLLSFPAMIISKTLIAHQLKKQLYILRILSPILKIFLFLILLPVYGIWGAVVSLLTVELFNLIILLVFLKKFDKYEKN